MNVTHTYICLVLAVSENAVGENEVALVPALHGPVAPLEQHALVVLRLGNLHVRVAVAFDDLPHSTLL